MKIKLNGDDRKWDGERVLRVHGGVRRHGTRTQGSGYVDPLDFNEKCPERGLPGELSSRS